MLTEPLRRPGGFTGVLREASPCLPYKRWQNWGSGTAGFRCVLFICTRPVFLALREALGTQQ